MTRNDVIRAWGRILQGYKPSLSIEVTRECPLHCPRCYAYEDDHLGVGAPVVLRQLADHKGDDLVRGVLALVRRYRPLHVSIVGGDPLVRYREIETLLPKLEAMGIEVQLVTSAFRPLPKFDPPLKKLKFVVSIDGLQPEHDRRRAPATYGRILRNIEGQSITIHCTATGQMMKRAGYLREFVDWWSAREEVAKIWVSFFTPQVGAESPECLSGDERSRAIQELLRMQPVCPKLDMLPAVIRELLHPPRSPRECIFAQVTRVISADFKTEVRPCQFGGNPDCSQCGCIASMGLASVGHAKVAHIPLGKIFKISSMVGSAVAKARG